MYLFECEATFEADPDAAWKAWTDVARWPEWDVSKEMLEVQGRAGETTAPGIANSALPSRAASAEP
jgi:uncharacterized protein YndB with AHSA1/START domain